MHKRVMAATEQKATENIVITTDLDRLLSMIKTVELKTPQRVLICNCCGKFINKGYTENDDGTRVCSRCEKEF